MSEMDYANRTTTRIPKFYGPYERKVHWWWGKTAVGGCYRCGGTGIYSQYHGECWGCRGTGNDGGMVDTLKFKDVPEDAQAMIKDAEIRRVAANALIRRAKKKAKADAQAEVYRREAAENALHIYATHPGLEKALETDHRIVRDIKTRIESGASISDAQAALVMKIARDEAVKADERASALPVPEGRGVVTGEVLSLKWVDTGYGESLKMLLKDDRGFKVYGSVPKGLMSEPKEDSEGFQYWTERVERGGRVTFTATLSPSDDDPKFGFFKRPAKASRLN